LSYELVERNRFGASLFLASVDIKNEIAIICRWFICTAMRQQCHQSDQQQRNEERLGSNNGHVIPEVEYVSCFCSLYKVVGLLDAV
jgi:phosphopantothenoylcysteine synthetase/decarboxylase